MSDVEKAISGLVEDEELLQQQQQQQQQQQHQSTPLNKTNINKYNLQHETGGTTLLQQHPHQPHSQHHHNHNQHHHHRQEVSCNSSSTVTAATNNYLTTQQYNCNCLSRLAKLIFSTPGLVVMVIVYTIMGAFIFPLLEAPQDISKSALIAKSREECLKELWIITEKLNVLYERNWTMLVHEQLRRFEGTIVAATRNMATAGGSVGGATSATAGATTGGYAGMATDTLSSSSSSSSSSATTALSRYGNNNFAEYSDLTATRWSFSEALLYSVTVITTIGHGSLTPRTAGGKIATIFYALIGVPLMLMCLSSLGALLADALQCTYARLCCRWPQYAVNGGDDLDDEMLRPKHKHLQHHAAKKRQQKPTTTTATNSLSMDMVMLEKERTHHEIKQSLHQQCDFQEHKNAINCKNCKYDAIIGESNTNANYDYKLCNDAMTATATAAPASSVTASTSLSLSSTTSVDTTTISSAMTTTMKLGHKEDCCQLLQNSPGKFTQHLSSCMQLRMSPTITVSSSGGTASTTIAAGTASSTAKQYYQQRPDVMLMTTGHKLSSQQPTTMATNGNGRMVVLPPPPPHSASASPASAATQQRFYQNTTGQPAMATYHIVTSASANSSPTHHQQSIRHYILPQLTAGAIPSPPTSSSPSSTQHYMAVPTNMLRFQQTTPQTQSQHQQQQQQQYGNIVNNTTSNINMSMNMNMNPLALPVSGSATVYFPIVTPAAAAALQNTSLTSGPLSSAISQPLIKYHTIQMPHKRQQNVMMLQQSDLRNDKQRNETLNNTEDDDVASAADVAQFPPPPPPAYQTATVHGIRRAKFLTKPLPQEINTLLQESDISCRHDLSQHLQTAFTSTAMGTEGVGIVEGNCVGGEQQMLAQHTPTTAHSIMLSTGRTENTNETETSMTTTAVTTNLSSFYGGISSNIATSSSTPPATPPPSSSASGMLTLNNMKTNTNNNNSTTTTAAAATIYENHAIMLTREGQLSGTQDTINRQQGLSSDGSRTTAAVDIMEDEEENEQQRLGNCPHGTPSRVPLLNSSSCSSNNDDKSHTTRSFLNATAASFHRHTLNTFHRSANAPLRKSVIINRKGECNLHIPKRRNSSGTTGVCYGGDPYDDMLMTSDDDCGMLEGQNVYKLKHLQPFNKQTDKHLIDQVDFCDNNSLVSLADSVSQIPQVPIIVVLFILIFYVSLGTVIFALWENWSLIDGAYFCFVTLTTIGYGDFVPLKTFQGPEIQLFACCAYLLLGLVLVAMAFSILETQLIWKCKRLAVRLKLAKE